MEKTDAWKEALLAAILETADERLFGRIVAARQAITHRQDELQHVDGAASDERRAMALALHQLAILERERLEEHQPLCRVCSQPVSPKDRKSNENGHPVHERCYMRDLLADAATRRQDDTL